MELLNVLTIAVCLFLALAALGWLYLKRFQTLSDERRGADALVLMQQQIEQLRVQFGRTLESHTALMQQQLGQTLGHVTERLRDNSDILNKTQQTLGERLDRAAQVVGDVQRSLGGLEEANRRIYEVGRDLASLQEILRAPKLRGGLGEFFLHELLAQILPSQHFALQHAFRSGEKVDAVIKLGGSLVPVDAKFPLENFRRMAAAVGDEERARARRQFGADVRRHIDAIAGKYIVPDEGTYDFALMYIPAENVYYETIIKDDGAGEKSLSLYALGKRVIPVSPNCLYAYLQAIVLGLKGLRLEDRARDVLQYLARLHGDLLRFRDEFGVLGRHIGHAQSCYHSAERRLDQFTQKFLATETDQVELCAAGPSKNKIEQ